jgi:hypothetical protein
LEDAAGDALRTNRMVAAAEGLPATRRATSSEIISRPDAYTKAPLHFHGHGWLLGSICLLKMGR